MGDSRMKFSRLLRDFFRIFFKRGQVYKIKKLSTKARTAFLFFHFIYGQRNNREMQFGD